MNASAITSYDTRTKDNIGINVVNDTTVLSDELYIDEVRNHLGLPSYCCRLCSLQFEAPLMVLHVNGKTHKELVIAVATRETLADRLVVVKSDLLQPTNDEIQSVSNLVVCCEKALKLVSDNLLTSGMMEERVLRGVMRVGAVANGLLLRGELNVHLVLLCRDKPTTLLLAQISCLLVQELPSVTAELYSVKPVQNEACIVVSNDREPDVTCTVTVTSELMRPHPFIYYNDQLPPDPAGVLPRDHCMRALANMRRARFYEAKIRDVPYCEVVIRLIRDLCRRVPNWSHLTLWMIEVIVYKCLVDADVASPALAVKRFFECLSSCLLIGDGPGLHDPCEREPTDLLTSVSEQQRETITFDAQHALRLITFEQIDKILAISADDVPLAAIRVKRKRGDG